jgi:hypothetical protein
VIRYLALAGGVVFSLCGFLIVGPSTPPATTCLPITINGSLPVTVNSVLPVNIPCG